jgi:hypothetical protein
MPQPNSFDPFSPPLIGQRRCPVCDVPMFLSVIEPTYQAGYDVRTFECTSCAYRELALTNSEDETVKDPEKVLSTEEEKAR